MAARQGRHTEEMPNVGEAQVVGYFSASGDEQYFDKRFLGFLVNIPDPDDVAFDLDHGYGSFINQGGMTRPLDGILRCILVNMKRPQIASTGRSTILDTDFVCRRGLLTSLMRSPCIDYHAKNQGWEKVVTLYKGIYYIVDADDGNYRESSTTDIKNSYRGWKFPQYVTASEHDGDVNIDRPVNNGEKYYTMVSRRLADHSVLFSCEVDCVDDQDQYVELKTARISKHDGHEKTFKRFKLLTWWTQSYLGSIPKIVAGFRDEEGIVRNVKTYKTSDLPRIASQGLPEKVKWKPAVCMNFVDRFFDFVKSNVVEDDVECVYSLSWQPGGNVACRKLEPGTFEKLLPDWYIEELKQM